MLEEAIENSGASIVAIDSLNRLTAEKNSDEDTAKRVSSKLQELVKKYKITLIVINHTTKSSNEGIQGGAAMSGSRIYGSEAEFLIAVNRTLANKRYIKLIYSRHDNDESDTVDQFEISDNRLTKLMGKVSESSMLIEQDGRQDGRVDDTKTNLILAEIESVCHQKGSNDFISAEISHLWKHGKFSSVTFYSHLKKLIHRNKVEELGKHNYRLL